MSTTLTRPRARRRVALPGQTGWIVAAVLATTVAVTTGVVVGLDDAPSAPSSTAIDEDAEQARLENLGLIPTAPDASSSGDLRLYELAKGFGGGVTAPAIQAPAMSGGDAWLLEKAREIEGR